MKNFLLKSLDKIILSLLAIFGFANCDMPVEYGTPYADFEISGTVTDSITSNPIKQLRVIKQDRKNPSYGDTVYTDVNGKYKFSFKDIPMEPPMYTLKTEDTDGGTNGGEFATRNVVVTFIDSDWVDDGDDNWYYGKAKKTQNIKLQPR